MKRTNFFAMCLCVLLASCNSSNGSIENDENVQNSITVEEVKVEEETLSIGDKSLHEVFGNVKKIVFTKQSWNNDPADRGKEYYETCDFDKEGRSLIANLKLNKEGAYVDENGLSCVKYDKDGKVISVSFGGGDIEYSEIKYDSEDRIINYFYFNAGGDSYSCTLTYDSEGNVNSKTVKGVVDMEPDMTIVHKYTILQKDENGNWLKRKRSDGGIDERQITYYE